MRIAFATCAAMPDGVEEERAAAALVGATHEIWDDPAVDWSAYDRVILRSVWDYTMKAEAFLAWTARIGPERLRNVPALVAWNADKRYLADVPVPTVPTTFVGPGDGLPRLEGEVVVKPNISAGARDTGRFTAPVHDEAVDLIERIVSSGRTALVQPYLPSVDRDGEVSMVHFGGELSHVLRKRAVLAPDEVASINEGHEIRAAAAMFQEDLVGPGTAGDDEIALARTVLDDLASRFGGPPLYARVDVVRGPDGAPLLLELEAVEPNFYLEHAPGAAERFATAVLAS